MKLKEFMGATLEYHTFGLGERFQKVRPRIICKNDVSLSVQAGKHYYSTPRIDGLSDYFEVEVGYPSVRPPNSWKEYFEGKWQRPGFVGYLKRIWSDRKQIKYAIRRIIKNRNACGWRHLLRLLFTKDNAINGIYCFIPIKLVEDWINANGGIDEKASLREAA